MDRSVEETNDWPEWVSTIKIGEAYLRFMQLSRAGKNEELNLQQIRQEFISRDLMSEQDKPYRTRVYTEEWENGELVKKMHYVTLWRFPTRLKIQKYLQDTFGLAIEDVEEDEGVGIVLRKSSEGPAF